MTPWIIEKLTAARPGISIVVPCFREEGAVEETVRQICEVMANESEEWELICVNDGSPDRTGEILDELAQEFPQLRVHHNTRNSGYGFSLKAGIRHCSYDKIVITDADGTYPNTFIPSLVRGLSKADMVVGARTLPSAEIPLVRRPAKWALLRYARWMANADIKDLNSGLRAIRLSPLLSFWSMLPDGFSFTTTITLAMHANQLNVEYVPIDYFKRVGKSSIKPIRDTFRFFTLVFRTIMYFRPLQVLGTVGLMFIASAIILGVVSRFVFGMLYDVSVASLFELGLVFLGLGLIGDLINARRS